MRVGVSWVQVRVEMRGVVRTLEEWMMQGGLGCVKEGWLELDSGLQARHRLDNLV